MLPSNSEALGSIQGDELANHHSFLTEKLGGI
jgi:hypothetical protein